MILLIYCNILMGAFGQVYMSLADCVHLLEYLLFGDGLCYCQWICIYFVTRYTSCFRRESTYSIDSELLSLWIKSNEFTYIVYPRSGVLAFIPQIVPKTGIISWKTHVIPLKILHQSEPRGFYITWYYSLAFSILSRGTSITISSSGALARADPNTGSTTDRYICLIDGDGKEMSRQSVCSPL